MNWQRKKSLADFAGQCHQTATPIAIAIVERDGSFLIGPRVGAVPLAGLWEFPGGKVHPGETPREAAARECREETGLSVEVGEAYLVHTHQYEHGRVELHFFLCRPLADEPPRAPFRWIAGRELASYEFPAGNRTVLDRLSKCLAVAQGESPASPECDR